MPGRDESVQNPEIWTKFRKEPNILLLITYYI